jgi:phosphate transport system protein
MSHLQQAHTSRDFESELRELRAQILVMGARCERMLRLSVTAFWDGVATALVDVEALDRQIDKDEMDIDALALRVLALRHPVAYDLRLLTGVMRLATNLERIGDESVNIAERAKYDDGTAKARAEVELRAMADATQDMLRNSLEAFSDNGATGAEAVLRCDDAVDRYYRRIMERMTAFVTEDASHAAEALRVMQVAKYLERIADHATNIAEEVIFIVRGENVRHRPEPLAT